MKKLVFIMITMVLSVSMAMAQGKGQRGGKPENVDPKVRAEKVTGKMAQELSLTDKQKKAVYDLNLATFQKRQEFKDNRKADKNDQKSERPTAEQREQWSKERDADREAYDAQMKKILTPQQYEKYTQFVSERKNSDSCTRGGKKQGKPCKHASPQTK